MLSLLLILALPWLPMAPQWNDTARDIEVDPATQTLVSRNVVRAQVRHEYRTYHNARFDYSISYPANLLIPQGESVNGDGQRFLSRDGRTELLVYGAYNSLDQPLREVFAQESSRSTEHPNRVVTYKVLRDDWFVVSGTENGRIFYQKTMLRNATFKTFRIEYDKSEKQTFDSITAFIARSFKG